MIAHSRIVKILKEYDIRDRRTGEKVFPGLLATRIIETLGKERSLPICLLNEEGKRCDKEVGIYEVIILSEDLHNLIKRG